jgi:hypothetical protein
MAWNLVEFVTDRQLTPKPNVCSSEEVAVSDRKSHITKVKKVLKSHIAKVKKFYSTDPWTDDPKRPLVSMVWAPFLRRWRCDKISLSVCGLQAFCAALIIGIKIGAYRSGAPPTFTQKNETNLNFDIRWKFCPIFVQFHNFSLLILRYSKFYGRISDFFKFQKFLTHNSKAMASD